MRYRVDELAARGGVSVDTVRFYQGQGLLQPPVREGRIAWYSDGHLEALRRILDLKEKGFSLTSIGRLLSGDLDAPDRALVDALAGAPPGDDASEGWLTLEDLSARTGVAPAILDAIEREGLLAPRMRSGRRTYALADAAAVTAGLKLLEAGLPLSELLALARLHGQAARAIAERAVDLFDEFVRRPLLASGSDDPDSAARLVAAFHAMFPATTALVAHNFGRVLLEVARERVEREGGEAELAALRGGAEGSWLGA